MNLPSNDTDSDCRHEPSRYGSPKSVSTRLSGSSWEQLGLRRPSSCDLCGEARTLYFCAELTHNGVTTFSAQDIANLTHRPLEAEVWHLSRLVEEGKLTTNLNNGYNLTTDGDRLTKQFYQPRKGRSI